jgi:hypothetical protein
LAVTFRESGAGEIRMKKRFLFLLVLAHLTAGCGGSKLPYYRTYSGPFLRENQVAILAVPGAVREMKIDSNEIHSIDPAISDPFQDNQTVLVEVPLGGYQLDFGYYVGVSDNEGKVNYFWAEYRRGSVYFDAASPNRCYELCLKYDEIDKDGQVVRTAPYIIKIQPSLDDSIWKRRREVYREQCKANPQLRTKK